MTSMWQWVQEASAAVAERCGDVPDVAVVLGSGLGDFADKPTGAVVGLRSSALDVTEQPVVQPSAVTMMTKDAALSAALRATLAAAERTSAAHR